MHENKITGRKILQINHTPTANVSECAHMTHYTYYAFKLLDCIFIWKLLSGRSTIYCRWEICDESRLKPRMEIQLNMNLLKETMWHRRKRETISNNDTAFHAKIITLYRIPLFSHYLLWLLALKLLSVGWARRYFNLIFLFSF